MKVLALVLSTLVSTILGTAAIIAVVFAAPHPSVVLLLLPTLAITVIFYGPLFLGSMSFYWDFNSSHGSRRYLRVVLAILIGLDVLAIAAVVLYAVLAKAALWLPIALVALAFILMLVAPLVGRSLRRYDDKHGPGQPRWNPIAPDSIRRKVRAIVITFVIALVVGFVGFFLLLVALDPKGRDAESVVESLLFALELAFFAAGFAAIMVSLSLARLMRAAVGRDPSVVRKVARVVLRGKRIELSEDEQRAAARYAPAAAVYLPFLLGYLSLLYAALLIQRVVSLMNTRLHDPLVDYGLSVVLILVLVVLFPLYIVRIRRARRYADEHADLTADAVPSETDPTRT